MIQCVFPLSERLILFVFRSGVEPRSENSISLYVPRTFIDHRYTSSIFAYQFTQRYRIIRIIAITNNIATTLHMFYSIFQALIVTLLHNALNSVAIVLTIDFDHTFLKYFFMKSPYPCVYLTFVRFFSLYTVTFLYNENAR